MKSCYCKSLDQSESTQVAQPIISEHSDLYISDDLKKMHDAGWLLYTEFALDFSKRLDRDLTMCSHSFPLELRNQVLDFTC